MARLETPLFPHLPGAARCSGGKQPERQGSAMDRKSLGHRSSGGMGARRSGVPAKYDSFGQTIVRLDQALRFVIAVVIANAIYADSRQK